MRMIGECGDAEQDGDGEEVLQEAQRVPVTDERDGEIADDEQPERLDVHGPEDEEAPHREEVGQAGDRPLQQPGLPEHLLELGGDALAEVVLAVVLGACRRTRADQLGQPQDALGGEYTSTSAVSPNPTTSLISIWVSTARLPPISYPRVTYLMLPVGNFRSGPDQPGS